MEVLLYPCHTLSFRVPGIVSCVTISNTSNLLCNHKFGTHHLFSSFSFFILIHCLTGLISSSHSLFKNSLWFLGPLTSVMIEMTTCCLINWTCGMGHVCFPQNFVHIALMFYDIKCCSGKSEASLIFIPAPLANTLP